MSRMKEVAMQDEPYFPLPAYPPFGMTSEQFAECQKTFTDYARGRILLGEKYDKLTHQRIETLNGETIIVELREEIADAVNYLTALDIYLERIPKALLN